VLDEYPQPTQPVAITVPLSRISTYLGLELEPSRIFTILKALDCQLTPIDKEGRFSVTPPVWRTDLEIPEDIVEEVARIYGYHNLPSTLMATAIPTDYPAGLNLGREQQAAQLLVGAGLQEVYTYSLVDAATAAQSGQPTSRHLAIRNPLSSDNVYLRQTLLPSLASVFPRLQRAGVIGAWELANVYWPAEGQAAGALPDEHLVLAIVGGDLRQLRGWVDTLWQVMHIEGVMVEESKINSLRINPFVQSALISTRDGRVLGMIGHLTSGIVGCELSWRDLLAVASRIPHLTPVPSTTPYREDLTLTLPAKLAVATVIQAARAASPLVDRVELISQYQNRSTLRLEYLDRHQQIDAESAAAVRAKVLKKVAALGATLS
jgi:phenylalanyl-tRNA synthetase beta subunit